MRQGMGRPVESTRPGCEHPGRPRDAMVAVMRASVPPLKGRRHFSAVYGAGPYKRTRGGSPHVIVLSYMAVDTTRDGLAAPVCHFSATLTPRPRPALPPPPRGPHGSRRICAPSCRPARPAQPIVSRSSIVPNDGREVGTGGASPAVGLHPRYPRRPGARGYSRNHEPSPVGGTIRVDGPFPGIHRAGRG